MKTRFVDLPSATKDRLLTLYDQGLLENSHALEHGIHPETMRRCLRRWRKERADMLDFAGETPTWMPDAPGKDWDDYVVIEEDDFIVISDIEIPDHDPAMLEAALLTAIAQNIKTLIIAGDYLATDNPTLTQWAQTWAAGNEINYEGAIGIALEILRRYLQWFDRIVILEGNHDDRINRATGGEVWFGMLLREAQRYAEDADAKVVFTRYNYLYVRTRRGPVYVCHQHDYSKTPVRLAQEHYAVQNGPDYDPTDPDSVKESCHIIVTHCHIYQSGVTPDDYREVHALGTMRNPLKTKYMRTKATKHTKWTQGFMMVKGGYFHNLSRKNTDWSSLLGEVGKDKEIMGLRAS